MDFILRKDLLKRLTVAAIVVGFYRPATAHPHVWISMTDEVLFSSDGKVTGISNAWSFDEGYSA